MAASTSTCALANCSPVASLASQPKNAQSLNIQKLALPLKTPVRCCASSPRSVQFSTESQEFQRISKAFSSDEGLPNLFIDETKGIVCYKTESGEMVCEGLDEGPHFYPPSGSNFYMPDTRAAAILPVFGEGMYEI